MKTPMSFSDFSQCYSQTHPRITVQFFAFYLFADCPYKFVCKPADCCFAFSKIWSHSYHTSPSSSCWFSQSFTFSVKPNMRLFTFSDNVRAWAFPYPFLTQGMNPYHRHSSLSRVTALYKGGIDCHEQLVPAESTSS